VFGIEEAIKEIESIGERRAGLGFGTDGAVIKVDNLKFREILVPFPPVEHIENVLEFDANALLNNLNGEVE